MSDVETGQKLDGIQETVTELRVSMATLSGDVRASLAKHDAVDRILLDIERRIRVLETRNHAIPTLATLVGLAALALAAWAAFRH